MKLKKLLFVGPDCVKCHYLLKKLQGAGITDVINGPVKVVFIKTPLLKILDTATVGGLAEARFHDVKELPALITIEEENREVSRIAGDAIQILGHLTEWARKINGEENKTDA